MLPGIVSDMFRLGQVHWKECGGGGQGAVSATGDAIIGVSAVPLFRLLLATFVAVLCKLVGYSNVPL